MKSLDPISLPLNQNALIEASAGTGKTYTITTLYLRAVLGLVTNKSTINQGKIQDERQSNLEFRPLSVDEILVVTFTEAATQELKERIRARLREAQKAVMLWWEHCGGDPYEDKTVSVPLPAIQNIDPIVQQVVEQACLHYCGARLADEQNQTVSISHLAVMKVFNLIQNGITLIDEASIFTIHGFCQRVLNQFAFETKMGFEQAFDLDNSTYVNQALYDFWRKNVIELTGAEFHLFKSYWKKPKALIDELKPLLDKAVVIAPTLIEEEYRARAKNYTKVMQQLWQELQQSSLVEDLLASGINKKTATYKKISLVTEFKDKPFGALFLTPEVLESYTTIAIESPENYRKNTKPISNAITATFDDAHTQSMRFDCPEVKGFWLEKAKWFIESGSKALKQEQQVLTPDDLLLKLEEALVGNKRNVEQREVEELSEAAGKEASVQPSDTDALRDTLLLKSAVRARYPLAFIDEFQDTDPVQYAIFKAIYQQNHKSELEQELSQDNDLDPEQAELGQMAPTMIMIGDPKQAIYKFRGADINTYIKAKSDVGEEQQYTLSKNFRSEQNLIHSINTIFANSECEFEHKAIPFIPVGAGQLNSSRVVAVDKQTSPVLVVNHLTANEQEGDDQPGLSFSESGWCLARHTAITIQKMLGINGKPSHVIAKPDNSKTAIEAKNIAVLVRDRRQAKLVKKELATLNVKSVYLSQDSVFDSELARDLVRILEAINNPSSDKKVRAATATLFFDYRPEELVAVQQDEQKWYRHLVAFFDANDLWTQGKVTSALDKILSFANTLHRWQQNNSDEFERRVTDYRHLVQLFQRQSAVTPGYEKLLVWAKNAVSEAAKNEESSLRLESDSNLVQIVTMHSSKGLEYPIVFAPFVTELRKEKNALYFCEKNNELRYRVDGRDVELQKAEQERLAEDIRLLYVAMTRAKYQLHLGVFNRLERSGGKTSSVNLSAFGRLVLGKRTDPVTDVQWQTKLHEYIQPLIETELAEFNVITAQSVADGFKQSKNQSMQNEQSLSSTDRALTYSEFSNQIDKSWTVMSFSALAHTENPSVVANDSNIEIENKWLAGASDEPKESETSPLAVSHTDSFDARFRFLFPKGANAGSCLHYMFEHLDFQTDAVAQQELLKEALIKFGLLDTVKNNVKPFEAEWPLQNGTRSKEELVLDNALLLLSNWLQDVLNCDINDSQTPAWQLSMLTPEYRLDEMEFYFDVKQIKSLVISNALHLSGFENVNYNNGLLSGDGLKGLIKGYIDLTCFINGKYYILDYKSNFVGDEIADYSVENLAITMSDHNYNLQLLIYSYALHTWLKARLPNYDYEQHFGGGIYLFLRGMTSPDTKHDENTTGVITHKVPLQALEYLENALANDVSVEA